MDTSIISLLHLGQITTSHLPLLHLDSKVLQPFWNRKTSNKSHLTEGWLFSVIVMTTLASKRIFKKKGHLLEIYIKLLRQQEQD